MSTPPPPPAPAVPALPEPATATGATGYGAALLAAGWQELPPGVGGRVYHYPGAATVVKVSEGDAAYVAFADYAEQNPNPCLPYLQVRFRATDWAVVEVEFLDPLDHENAAELAAWANAWFAYARYGGTQPPPKLWSDTADALRAIASASGSAGFDFKRENARQRGPDLVFTDPLAP